MTPNTRIDDRYVCIGDWCPHNYEGNLFGNITLTQAFQHSVNTAAVAVSIKTGRQPIADLAHRMGITSDFPVTRSLALGVAEVSVIDMASAYSVLPVAATRPRPMASSRSRRFGASTIFNKDVDAPRERMLTQQTVGYMDTLMRAVVTGGTGTRAAVDGVPAVGKTGTTSDYRDAWFCGFTGNYVATVWYGNDDYQSMNTLTGGTTAGHDLAEIHGLCPHQHRDQTGLRHRLQASALCHHRVDRRPTSRPEQPSGRPRSSRRPRASCST